jgi:MarR family transcriptional regulator, 2-MHQ and catechol-resistance regulon repressor
MDLPISTYVKLLRTADALHADVSRGLLPEGLTSSQFSTLKVLRQKGKLAQRDIARYLVKSGGNVTIVVDNLTRVGLVERVRDTEDRRIVFVSLTEAGKELFDRLYPPHLERIREGMEALPEADLAELSRLLEQLHPSDQAECPAVPETVNSGSRMC